MKITSKLMMLNVEHQITVGNDAITATVIHQICYQKEKMVRLMLILIL
jgi:hypothetical protein